MDKTKYENKMITNIREVPLHGLQPGKSITIKVDKNGTPVEYLWRKRKRDGDIRFEEEEIEKPKKNKKGRDE